MINWLHDQISPVAARLSLALRVALLTTTAVGMTLAVVSAMVFFTVRAEFETSLDESMLRRANAAVKAGVTQLTLDGVPQSAFAATDVKIAVVQGGRLFSTQDSQAVTPYIGQDELQVSIGDRTNSFRSAKIGGVHYRVVAVQAGQGTALVLAQSMESSRHALERLQLILWLSSAVGVAIAGLTGWIVATNGLRPVRRLTEAAERVARTQELTPIAVAGHDELARLTTSFNSMLLALDASQERQRQLVADAGHELRTPLTSLRTNIELLSQASESPGRQLSDTARTEIMGDVRAQLQELTTLVGDLMELARDEPLVRDPEPVDLSDVVSRAVERVQLRATNITFDVETESWMVVGEQQLLERAVTNLLDNAAKWSPPLGTVRIGLSDGVLTVTDDGPGINDEDLPHVFDRFYRSSEARTLPGSGLGLSIARRAAERHGGSITAGRAEGGGTLMTMRIPSA